MREDRRTRSLQRRAGTAILLAYLVALVLSEAHLGSARHTVCPQDGAIVHGTCVHASGGSKRGQPPSTDESRVVAGDPAAHEQHCIVFASVRVSGVVGTTPLRVLAIETGIERVAVLADRPRASSVPLWLVAPKQSPPV